MKHLITKEKNILHGTIGWSHNGKDGQYCEAGETVKIKWQPAAGWGLQEVHYTDGDGNEVTIENGEFVMPDSDIIINAMFRKFVVGDWVGEGDIMGSLSVVKVHGEDGNISCEGSIFCDGNIYGNAVLSDTQTGTEYVLKVTNGVLGIEEL